MSYQFGFDLKAALAGARPTHLRHRPDEPASSIADSWLREIYPLSFLASPKPGRDQHGMPLPAPLLDPHAAGDFMLTYPAQLMNNLLRRVSVNVSGRQLDLLPFVDQSALLFEEIPGIGTAVFPEPLFSWGVPNEEELAPDMDTWACAMRNLPPLARDARFDDKGQGLGTGVIPAWQPFRRTPSSVEAEIAKFINDISVDIARVAAFGETTRSVKIILSYRRLLRNGKPGLMQIEVLSDGRNNTVLEDLLTGLPDCAAFPAPPELTIRQEASKERVGVDFLDQSKIMEITLFVSEAPTGHEATEALARLHALLNGTTL